MSLREWDYNHFPGRSPLRRIWEDGFVSAVPAKHIEKPQVVESRAVKRYGLTTDQLRTMTKTHCWDVIGCERCVYGCSDPGRMLLDNIDL